MSTMRNDPVNARFESSRRVVVVTFADGSEIAWPVLLLEMIIWSEKDDGWVQIKPTNEQLEAVCVGGDHLYWDELGQDFLISDLMAGVYGRPEWMRQLESRMETAAIAS